MVSVITLAPNILTHYFTEIVIILDFLRFLEASAKIFYFLS